MTDDTDIWKVPLLLAVLFLLGGLAEWWRVRRKARPARRRHPQSDRRH